ncbi:lipid scramblase CLPTM1L [Bacillus rossius redtenbacheri]|uniref:lipid scramblase CLPTM1L n=1 Tax=Bacillus rossius redtenbacheri TaxID=93214 RepID=UPI002FDE5753
MRWPSVSMLLSGIFVSYILYSIWTLAQLFIPPSCKGGHQCIKSFLHSYPKFQLLVYSSLKVNPSVDKDVTLILDEMDFDYNSPLERTLSLELPAETRRNGTLFMHLFLQAKRLYHWEFWELLQEPTTAYLRVKLTQLRVPEAATFQLLGSAAPQDGNLATSKSRKLSAPVSHIKSRVTFNVMTDDIVLPQYGLPPELIRLIMLTRSRQYLPLVQYDFLNNRLRDLVEIKENVSHVPFTLVYSPVTFGKLRLMQHVRTALKSLQEFGFTEKDVDEVKGIFADTNLYLLCITIFVSAIHLLFDFLAFKNDVSFWRNTQNLAGLSSRTVAWRAFSQSVVFLYLLDESTSLLVLVPTGVGMLIEMWKVQKLVRVRPTLARGFVPWLRLESRGRTEAEQRTQQFDAESMRYLSYLLYPLCVGGAVYSLLYEPHKSWYSWTVHSLVNGVYAFGFLFMLPQLFVNYKLKSVAHLPWRAFMYKAFNTFIDDLFAFIITMPTAHRVACFRDDVVFLIYLYQRWLYPVDKSRRDESSPVQLEDSKKKD